MSSFTLFLHIASLLVVNAAIDEDRLLCFLWHLMQGLLLRSGHTLQRPSGLGNIKPPPEQQSSHRSSVAEAARESTAALADEGFDFSSLFGLFGQTQALSAESK